MYELFDASQRSRGLLTKPDGTPIAVIDYRPEIYEHIVANGKTWSVCCISSEKDGYCEAYEIKDFDGDTDLTDEMLCPWCGHEQQDTWEYSDDEGVIQCQRCGRDFSYQREIHPIFTTSKDV